LYAAPVLNFAIMATKKKAKKKPTKPKKSASKRPARKKASASKALKHAKKVTKKKAVPKRAEKQTASKKQSARKKQTRKKSQNVGGPAFSSKGRSGDQSGDLQGLSRSAGADSESVDELLDEGNAFEADAVMGVEDADNAEEKEVHTHEVPEDDVPEEYLDTDKD
jgi:hypothetical protein